MVAPMFPPQAGGAATHAFYLAQALGELKGVRVDVVAPGEQLHGGDRYWLPSRRIQVHRTEFSAEPSKPPFRKAIKTCLSIYQRIAADPGFARHGCGVVHGQHFAGAFIAMHLKHTFNIPCIATIHKTPIGRGLSRTVWETDPTYAHFSYVASWPIDAFVAGSQFFQSELQRHKTRGRVVPIYHGVPIRWLWAQAKRGWNNVPNILNIDEGTELVVCPARWDSRKRPDDFIRAAGKVKSEMAGRRIKFLMTARVDESELEKVKSAASEAGIADDLIVKEIDFEYLPAVLAAADVCVVPTEREGLGISVLEALALKAPVVATDAEGIKEIITSDEYGYLYASGEVDHLSEMMVTVLRNRRQRRQTCNNGYRLVKERFDHNLMARAYEQLYRSLLDRQ